MRGIAVAAAALLAAAACKQSGGDAAPPPSATAPLSATGAPQIATGQPLAPTPLPAMPPVAGDVSDRVMAANRKMMHGDGAGCLAELDAVAKNNPSLDKSLLMIRAQCEMLVGKCQQGKKTIAEYYEREVALSPERAQIMAEQIGSMRCRGGDMTDRDRLLTALYELSDGAYVNKRSAEDCEANVKRVKELAPKVPPRDPDDGQVRGGPTALFHTGAACLARAGDCVAAYRVYVENYPPAIGAIKDPILREKTIADGFRSSIERCKDADIPGAPNAAPDPNQNPMDSDPLKARH